MRFSNNRSIKNNENIVSHTSGADSDRIFIRDNSNCFVKVQVADILWIKAGGSYSIIETTGGRFVTSHNLKYIEGKIQNLNLVRIHRSYIINLLRVKQINAKNFVILDLPPREPDSQNHSLYNFCPGAEKEIKIPIGPEYRSLIKKIINLI